MHIRLKSVLNLLVAILLGVLCGNLVIYHPGALLYAVIFFLLIMMTGVSTYITQQSKVGILSGVFFWICIFLWYEIKIGWSQWQRFGIHPDYVTATSILAGLLIVGIPATIISCYFIRKRRWIHFGVYLFGGSMLFYIAIKFLMYGIVHYPLLMNTF